jgi:hypothetical protein
MTKYLTQRTPSSFEEVRFLTEKNNLFNLLFLINPKLQLLTLCLV